MTFFITPFHYTDCFSVRQIGYGGTNDPEEIYTLFRDPVPGYDGRPIGISDVLELYDASGSEFYYCDRVGFQQIEFAPRQEMNMCL